MGIAVGAVVVVIVLQCLLINELSVGAWWFAPVLELVLLAAIVGRFAASSGGVEGGKAQIRKLVFVLVAFILAVNFLALFHLLQALITGRSEVGSTLLLDAVNVWTTNVIAFALAFWCVDHGGPLGEADGYRTAREFLFPQHTTGDANSTAAPGFLDYLFLSFTTATAFSPTDTAPLTQKMKMLMMAEASISFLTVALVAARAVNILA